MAEYDRMFHMMNICDENTSVLRGVNRDNIIRL